MNMSEIKVWPNATPFQEGFKKTFLKGALEHTGTEQFREGLPDAWSETKKDQAVEIYRQEYIRAVKVTMNSYPPGEFIKDTVTNRRQIIDEVLEELVPRLKQRIKEVK